MQVLEDRGVDQGKILFLTLIAAPEGVHHICSRFPRLKVITTEIDERVDPDTFHVLPGEPGAAAVDAAAHEARLHGMCLRQAGGLHCLFELYAADLLLMLICGKGWVLMPELPAGIGEFADRCGGQPVPSCTAYHAGSNGASALHVMT